MTIIVDGQEKHLASALSGGGFCVAVFHLRVLCYLHARNMLW